MPGYPGICGKGKNMNNEKQRQQINGVEVTKEWVDGIPVIYAEPAEPQPERRLALFLSGLGGKKEELVSYLSDIADRGFIALAFDLYQHGERGTAQDDVKARVFTNMRRYGWPVLGQTILDVERVIDWAVGNLEVVPQIRMGGISMGGDITICAAGIDSRIKRGAPIIATPDWLRPGMYDLFRPDRILDPGTPDRYASFFYEQFNPITHLERYANCPPMCLILGAEDNHIPPENAERFRSELAGLYPEAADRLVFHFVTGTPSNHMDIIARRNEWWEGLLDWWLI